MKTIVATIALSLVIGSFAFAEENKTSATGNEVTTQATTITKEKKSRKKKIEMCGECGKPESECECHGKDGKKKDEQKK